MPADVEQISVYAQFLSRSFKSVNSIRNYIQGVKLMHLLAGLPFPHLGQLELKLVLRGISRLNPYTPHQPLPITPPVLLKMFAVMNLSIPIHATLWCCFLMAFYLFARKSNTFKFSFDPKNHLRRGDLRLGEAGVLVTIRWSKTIQCAERVLLIPLVAVPNSPLCPVAAFRRMFKLVPGRKSGPAFLVPVLAGLESLTHVSFTRYLHEILNKAGYVASAYSGHSFHRGGATWAFSSGVPGELIRLHGDWHSDAYLRYLEYSVATKLTVTAEGHS